MTEKSPPDRRGQSHVALLVILYKKPTAPLIALDKEKWNEFRLMKKIPVSFDTAIYRFELPSSEHILGLPVGQHISIQADINGKTFQRSYTPISSDDDKGYFDLLIKSYPHGIISKYVREMKIGDTIRVRGPKGNMKYVRGLCDSIGMIAGGTGITPMLQIIRAILKDKKDKTKISLIFANIHQGDILLKKELDELMETHSDQFKVYYVLNYPPPEWKGGKGFVTKDMIKEHLSSPQENCKLFLCGPSPMVSVMKQASQELGFPKVKGLSKLEDQVFCF